MVRVLFINCTSTENYGEAAMVIGTTLWLKKVVADVSVYKYSADPDIDQKTFGRYGITPVKRCGLCLRKPYTLLIDPLALTTSKCVLPIREQDEILTRVDLILDLSGDSFAQSSVFRRTFFSTAYEVLRALVWDKPLIMGPQSIGPFDSAGAAALARALLARAKLVMAREGITYSALVNEFGLPNARLVLDAGFEMPAVTERFALDALRREGIEAKDGLLVGVTPDGMWPRFFASTGMSRKLSRCITSLAGLLDHLVARYGATVVIIPHSTAFQNDDRGVISSLLSATKVADQIRAVSSGYGPEETKGIIGQCRVFIGGRMHACIAALSQGVPTIALSRSHKYSGIMGMLGLGDFVWDVMDCDASRLISLADELVAGHVALRTQIQNGVENLRQQACKIWELVADIALS